MARPFPEVALPDRLAVRPVHRPAVHLVRREDRRPAVHQAHREGRRPVRLDLEEDHRRQEARRPGRKAPRWGAELQVRVVA